MGSSSPATRFLIKVGVAASILTGCGAPIQTPTFPTADQVAADHRAIGIPYGRFVLLRTGKQLVALHVTWASPIGEQINFEWHAPSGGQQTFNHATFGKGSAVEVRYIGRIAAGPLVLDWSRGSRDMGWIYWPDDDTDLAVCSRAWADLDKADPDSPDVRWYTREMFE
jgi:hypothetical protein